MKIRKLLFIILLITIALHSSPNLLIPVTGSKAFGFFSNSPADPFPSITEFIAEITETPGSSGIFVEKILADRLVQQPQGNPSYVSSEEYTVTQFGLAFQFGTIGILAHNTAAGAAFFDLQVEDVVLFIHSNGDVQPFKVTEIQKYQALIPDDPYSNFVDLSNPSEIISAQSLFLKTYGRGEVLIFQTCIENAGDPSWGRLFVIAQPLTNISDTTHSTLRP